MVYKQIFKSLSGCQRRVAFENAHVKRCPYGPNLGKRLFSFNVKRVADGTYRMERLSHVL